MDNVDFHELVNKLYGLCYVPPALVPNFYDDHIVDYVAGKLNPEDQETYVSITGKFNVNIC